MPREHHPQNCTVAVSVCVKAISGYQNVFLNQFSTFSEPEITVLLDQVASELWSEPWSEMNTDTPGFDMGAGGSEFRSSCWLGKHFTH